VSAAASLVLNFLIPRLVPGDPLSAILARLPGPLDERAVAALRAAFGVRGESLPRQFVSYLGHLATGDLGLSVAYFPSPVSAVIAGGLRWTLFLGGTAVIVSFAVGSLLGVLAAGRRGGWLEAVLPPALVFVGAFPYFFLAMLALYLFGFQLGWFPLRHAHGAQTGGLALAVSVARHAALPALVIVASSMGGWMLNMRAAMVNVLREDFVAFARAKGLSRRRVLFRYAARAALLPSVTAFGMALGFVLSGSLLTEIVFSYPGQGYLLIQAVRTQDFPLMQGIFLTITFAVLGANALVDLLTVWLDPRVRMEGRA
jgi:peptide/nickel transport system permease protein